MSPWKVKRRFIQSKFDNHFFKPRGIPMTMLEIHTLAQEELEAVRLIDAEHLNQEEAAKRMGVSRSTIQRIIEKAREKIALALINGDAIEIKGGNYSLKSLRDECRKGNRTNKKPKDAP